MQSTNQELDFYQIEATDGTRFSWNNFPSTKLSATRAVLPVKYKKILQKSQNYNFRSQSTTLHTKT